VDKEEILLGVILLGLVAVLAYAAAVFFLGNTGEQNTRENYNEYLSNENKDNICLTPQGYTDQQWKEHMSHHPDRYAECLKK
jgi:hypothetical protein